MNCANHPDRPVAAYCQACGKALCTLCLRTYNGLTLCEPHLLEREVAAPASGGQQPGWNPVAGPASGPTSGPAPGPASGAMPGAAAGPRSSNLSANPVIAALLGFIPGVGAMYNGQFIKALLHVVIFVVLIGASEHFDLVGILIAAWVFYQVFDAAHTAVARRDGRPLPDPFGLLDMSQRLGPQNGFQSGFQPGFQAGFQTPPPASNVPPAGWSTPPAQPVPPPPGPSASAWAATPGSPYPTADLQPQTRRSEPVGAIVLIVMGLLFLLSTLGWLNVDWIGRGWPLLLMLAGGWLLYRRVHNPVVGPSMSPGAGSGMVAPPVPPAPPANPGAGLQPRPLSITRWDETNSANDADSRHEGDRS